MADEIERKWTAGPWVAWRNGSFWQVDAEGYGQIGDTCSSSCDDDDPDAEARGKANAALMAAAPDLYEALTLAREYMRYSLGSRYEGPDPYPIIDAALLRAHPQTEQQEGR